MTDRRRDDRDRRDRNQDRGRDRRDRDESRNGDPYDRSVVFKLVAGIRLYMGCLDTHHGVIAK